jgi:hypothetical protein
LLLLLPLMLMLLPPPLYHRIGALIFVCELAAKERRRQGKRHASNKNREDESDWNGECVTAASCDRIGHKFSRVSRILASSGLCVAVVVGKVKLRIRWRRGALGSPSQHHRRRHHYPHAATAAALSLVLPE